MTKKIIVTGVTGQDGSYMVDYLLANTPHFVYGMVRRTAKPDYSNLAAALNHPRFQFVTGDLSDTTSIDNLVKEIKPDYFINLAAQSFVGASWKLPEQTLDVTGIGVLRCLEAIRKHVPGCRFYSAGSSEQFGAVEYSPQDEKHPMRPQSPYGAAKCLAAHVVRVYRESYQLYAVHGILFNHEGPRRGEEFVTRKITKGVARIAAAIKAGQPFEPLELGNLDAKRDWSDARDFVDGIWKMLNQESPAQEYVLASGETHTVREFVELTFKEAGITNGSWSKRNQNDPQSERFELHYVGMFIGQHFEETNRIRLVPDGHSSGHEWAMTVVRISPDFYRPAEVSLLHGDSTRARTELGWSPKYSFQQLVSEMVATDMAVPS